MTLLLDNNLPPSLAQALGSLGHATLHVAALGLATALDSEVIREASKRDAVLITADTDFPQLLALSGAKEPSVVLLVQPFPSRPEPLAVLIANQIAAFEGDLRAGAVISLSSKHVRVRSLPIGG